MVQTKSPMVLRDVEILKRAGDAKVGFTLTTADERIRKIFEPEAPPSRTRIEGIEKLHLAGVRTFAMIAPILPGAEGLVRALKGKVEYVTLDRMNYHYADWAYARYDMQWAMEDTFFYHKGEALKRAFESEGISCEMVFS